MRPGACLPERKQVGVGPLADDDDERGRAKPRGSSGDAERELIRHGRRQEGSVHPACERVHRGFRAAGLDDLPDPKPAEDRPEPGPERMVVGDDEYLFHRRAVPSRPIRGLSLRQIRAAHLVNQPRSDYYSTVAPDSALTQRARVPLGRFRSAATFDVVYGVRPVNHRSNSFRDAAAQ